MRATLAVCVALAWLGLVPAASAQPAASGFRMYGSLGAGFAVSPDQLGYLDYDGIVGRAALSVGHAIGELVVVEGQGAAAIFGSSREDGSLFELGGGVRIDWRTPIALHVTPASHLHLASTGGEVRPTIDLSVGVLFELARAIAVGPVVQYGQVIQPDGERYSTDARYFTVALGFGYRPPLDDPAAPARPQGLLEIRTVEEASPPSDAPPEPPLAPPAPLAPEIVQLIEGASPSCTAVGVDMMPPILFEHDSVELIPCGEAALFQARDAIVAHAGGAVIEGHADGTGEDEYNLDLARRRAEHVRDWLVAQGIDATRLRVESLGEKEHLAEEKDATRLQLNRRVIIRLEPPP